MAVLGQQTTDSEEWHRMPGCKHTAAARTIKHAPGTGREMSAATAKRGAIPRQQRRALLTQVVEAEILPRLAMIRGTSADPIVNAAGIAATEDDTSQFVRLLLAAGNDKTDPFIAQLQSRGATALSLYLGLVTQAARVLGTLWDEDRCDFTQVTIALGRLQQIVRGLSPQFQASAISHAQPPHILLVPAPGEQHTFGLLIVAEFFQRDGWTVAGGPATAPEEAFVIARDTWIDVVGFSVASPPRVEGLATCIRTLRRA